MFQDVIKPALPFDDIFILKIYAFDPDCGTANQDLTDLAVKFDNIILS